MIDFIGTWRLVAFQQRNDDGTTMHPYGPDPIGLLIYDETGRVAVQIMSRERLVLGAKGADGCSLEELRNLIAGFTAFFGTYEVNERDKIVTHFVQAHLLPDSVGKALKRRYEFRENCLILMPSPDRSVIWERMLAR